MSETSDIASLNEWYQKPIGVDLLRSEILGLESILPQIFGYYIMQIGGSTDKKMLATSPIHNHIFINPDKNHPISKNSLAIQCQLDELPLAPESIDAAILFHILEFTRNPKTILKEVYTSLMPNGYAIIFGFNPYSLWGVAPLWKKQKEIPWQGKWISPGCMRHLLDAVGFSIGDYKTFYFRPPNNNECLLFLEGIGQIFWPYCGASYMFVAHKNIIPLTPVRPVVSFMKKFIPIKALPKPTSMINQCNKNQQQ